MYYGDVMNPVLHHRPGCVYLGTLVGNLILAFIATFVASVHSTGNQQMPRAPRPEFLPGQTNITVREGGVAILPCSVKSLGTKQVAWRRIEADKFLTIGKMTWAGDDHISLEYSKHRSDVSNFNLVIKRAKPKDQGVYECQITSRIGHVRHIQLNIVGPPITNPETGINVGSMGHMVSNRKREEDSSHVSRETPTQTLPDNIPHLPVILCRAADDTGCLISITGLQYVDLGEKIELKCNASGGARVADEMDWFKAGDKIDSDKYSHVIIEKYKSMETRSFISILIIERSKLKDTGDYICRSSRNDIANMKVTVLHAETEKERRGTENGRTHGSYQVQGNGTDSSSNLSPSTIYVIWLLCTCLAVSRWIGGPIVHTKHL